MSLENSFGIRKICDTRAPAIRKIDIYNSKFLFTKFIIYRITVTVILF